MLPHRQKGVEGMMGYPVWGVGVGRWDQQADDWGSGSARSFLRPPFMCAYGCVSSKAGPSSNTGPLAAACPECLSRARPGEAVEEGGEVEGAGPEASGVPGAMGCAPWEEAGASVEVGSSGTFSMFSTSMSSSSVSGGLFSSL